MYKTPLAFRQSPVLRTRGQAFCVCRCFIISQLRIKVNKSSKWFFNVVCGKLLKYLCFHGIMTKDEKFLISLAKKGAK